MTSRMVINQAAKRRLLYGSDGPVYRAVADVARSTQGLAKAYAPIDSGRLRSSITATVTAYPARNRVTARIGTRLPYGLWQEKGTGIYGPMGRPITPKTKRWLRFIPKGGDHYVFARSVRGVRPQHYLTRALVQASPWPVRRIAD